MISLAIYVISFVVILGVMGSISIFFRKNTEDIDTKAGIAAEYNKFNLYMLEFTKNGYDMKIENLDDNKGIKITFSKKDNPNNTVIVKYENGKNYLNFEDKLNNCEFKLCKDIDEFQAKPKVAENSKKVLQTYININGTVYTTDYVIE